MKSKWQSLHLWSRWSVRLVVGIELLLLFFLLGQIVLRNNQSYEYSGIFTIDEDGNASTDMLYLPEGIYKVQLRYTCDNNMSHFCNVESVSGGQGSVYSSGEHLYQGLGETDFDLWLQGQAGGAQLKVTVEYGEGEMSLEGLTFQQTSRDLTRKLFLTMVGIWAINSIFLLYLWNQTYPIEKKKLLIGLGLFATIIISSIPLGNNHMYAGSDITYHLLRIDNIKDGFLSGQFPVRIDPSWLYGHGYASSVCYGELFLYLPAFLRLIGFTLQGSWMWFLFLLNVATCLLSYYSFRRIFQRDGIGFLCCVLYTLSIYRLYKMYSWSAIGEVQAMVFLPLILYAVYRIYTENVTSKCYKRSWIVLAVGMTGIVQCHFLTCEMAAVFLGLLCLILWKKTFRKQTLLVFLKAIAAVFLLNAWFLIPFLDYMISEDMIIHHVSARTIQEIGLYPAQLFFSFFHRGESRDLVNNGLREVEALGVGISLMFGLGVFLLLWISRQRTETEDMRIRAGKVAAILAMLAMAMSLEIFPWTWIQFQNKLTETLVSSIQYPNRFLMIATLLLTLTVGAAAVWLTESNHKEGQKTYGSQELSRFFSIAIGILAVVTGTFYSNSLALHAGKLTMYDSKGMGSGYLSGAEYLPYGTEINMLTYHNPIAGDGVQIEGYYKEALQIIINGKNTLDQESYVEVPLLHYKGYQAKSLTDNRNLTILPGKNHCIRVLLPAGYQGNIRISFQQPWYWQAGNLVSLCMILYLIYMARKCCKITIEEIVEDGV